MKYSFVAVSALATAVVAQPTFLNTAFDVVEGKAFDLKIAGCESGCTVLLQHGESKNLKDVKTLATGAKDGSIEVKLDGLPTDTYNFKVIDASGSENYSAQFKYEGTGAPLSTTAAQTTAAQTTAAQTTAAQTTSAAATTSVVVSSSAVSIVSVPVSTKKTPVTPETTEAPKTTMTPPASVNSTIATLTKTKSAASGTTGAAETSEKGFPTATTVPASGAGRMTSSLALIAGAVAAMVYLN